MADLIDRQTLAEEIESLTVTVAGKPARWNDAKHSVLRIIGEAGTVDAVAVVRCKDCKHREKCNLMTDDDFCSYGERREENAAD